MRREGAGLPNVGVLLAHTDHDTLVTWTTDDGSMGRVSDWKRLANTKYIRENSTRSIITYVRAQQIASAITTIPNLPATGTAVSEGKGRREPKKVLTAGFAHSGTVVDDLIIRKAGHFSRNKRALTRAATSSSMVIGYSLVR